MLFQPMCNGAFPTGNPSCQSYAPLESHPAWASSIQSVFKILMGVAVYDPVECRGFHRSRSGRVMARCIVMLNAGAVGWLVTQSAWGWLFALLLLPFF